MTRGRFHHLVVLSHDKIAFAWSVFSEAFRIVWTFQQVYVDMIVVMCTNSTLRNRVELIIQNYRFKALVCHLLYVNICVQVIALFVYTLKISSHFRN
jgi:hypothetical protein